MNDKNKDTFWSIILVGFTILVIVWSVLGALDNKIGTLTPMEQEALKGAHPLKVKPEDPKK